MIFDAHFHYAVCYDMGLIGDHLEGGRLPSQVDVSLEGGRLPSQVDVSLEGGRLPSQVDVSLEGGCLPSQVDINLTAGWTALSCAHSFAEWERQKKAPSSVYQAFGIHPQLVGQLSDRELMDYMNFLEDIAATGQVDALGEIGFDLFTEDLKNSLERQKAVWEFELEVATKYNLPIVVHCRKANDLLFKYSKEMKKLPGVLFHSFMGSVIEAKSLINRNINCCFSFGKQMMNNNKKVIDCVQHLPMENLLLETDAPFQKLKGEENTLPEEIMTVYKESYKLRQKSTPLGISLSFEEYCDLIFKNAKRLVSSIQI